jgi:hypothetical protein
MTPILLGIAGLIFPRLRYIYRTHLSQMLSRCPSQTPMYSAPCHHKLRSMMSFTMVFFLWQEKGVDRPVYCECSKTNAESREGTLKSCCSGKRTVVSPCFSVAGSQYDTPLCFHGRAATNALLHGSFAGDPAAAASFLGSKPVIFGGAIAS